MFEEFYLKKSPCQWMFDLSRGQTTAEPRALMQTETQSYYPQRALTTLLQLFNKLLVLSKEKQGSE